MMNKLNMMLVGLNNKSMDKKLSLTLPPLPIETEKLLNKPLNTENGSKEKSPIPTPISNGSPEDKIKLIELLLNFLSPDVKLTNYSSNNLKNTMMLLELLLFSELNLPEVKLLVKLQFSLKLKVKDSQANFKNMNICSNKKP